MGGRHLHELLEQIELTEIRLIERNARLKVSPEPSQGLRCLAEADPEGQMSIAVLPVSWDARLETWFRLTLSNEQAEIVTAVAVVYQRETDAEIPPELRTEFIERVAVMAAYPYLRTDLQHQAIDLHLGNVTLPILRQGEFQLPEDFSASPHPE